MTRERLVPRPLTGRPTVSVVIPCYNYGHYLPQAVESALSQEGVDVEVIVVDDCSTDDSRSVACVLADEDPRIRLVLHEQNMGHIGTYNDGLGKAKGDHVVLLSADDVLAPGSLARSSALLEARPDVGLVYGYADDFRDTIPTPRTVPASWTVWQGASWLGRICSRGTNIIVNPEAMLRTTLMDELAGYDPTMPHAADMDLWMRAAARSNVGRVNGVDQAFYRVHELNMHSTQFAGLLTDMAERRKVFDAFFATPGSDLPGAARLHTRARRALALEALRVACLAMDQDGSHGGAEASVYAAFAKDCFPSIHRSPRWAAYVRRQAHPAGWTHRQLTAQTFALRWKWRWRRWRRFGT